MLLALVRILAFALGATLVGYTLRSAVVTFVLPRGAPDGLTRLTFLAIRHLFALRLKRTVAYAQRDRVMALFAPTALLALPFIWIVLVIGGYTGMFWAVSARSLQAAFTISGSSLLTLGFAVDDGVPATALTFSEAAIGLTLVALLIAYLPTIYGSFSRREAAVTLLEVRAGSPPSACEMLKRFQGLGRLDALIELWSDWELWFVDIDESHTSLGALPFFRSPQPDRSWITAAGAVLDAAAFASSTLDIQPTPEAALCLRAGFLALRHISDFFGVAYNHDPQFPADPISVSRAEWDAAYEELRQAGVPLKPDREQAWRDWAGWRVTYDRVLLALCSVVMAPTARWSGDRAPAFTAPPLLRPRSGSGQLARRQPASRTKGTLYSATTEEDEK